jgi:hypothetical protein
MMRTELQGVEERLDEIQAYVLQRSQRRISWPALLPLGAAILIALSALSGVGVSELFGAAEPAPWSTALAVLALLAVSGLVSWIDFSQDRVEDLRDSLHFTAAVRAARLEQQGGMESAEGAETPQA